MFTVKSKSEFLSDIRALHPNLINVRLNSVEVDRNKRSIRYNFICDKTVDDELKNLLLKEAEKITLPAFNVVTVTVKKIASDVELICNAIMKFLTSNYPSISVFLKTTDLSCSVGESQVRYKIKFTKDVIEYIQRNNVFHKLNEYLGKNFCSEFIGSYEEKEQEESKRLGDTRDLSSQNPLPWSQCLYFPHIPPFLTVGSAAPDTARIHPKKKDTDSLFKSANSDFSSPSPW